MMMTVSLVSCKFESAQHRDIALYHEDKMAKVRAGRPQTSDVKSPKRDPITQDNNEPNVEFRSCVKRMPESDKTTIFTDEQKFPSRNKGEFNDLFRARSVSPRVQGIRACNPYKEFQPEVKKRELKDVDLPFRKNIFNPITEGDPLSIKTIKTRVQHPEPSAEYQKMNNKLTVLPADLGNSPQGKIFRDTNKILGEEHPEAYKERSPARPKRQYKDRSEGKALIEYSYSPDFRDQGVSGKPTQVPISTLLVRPVEETLY